jgi:hypothetical protein
VEAENSWIDERVLVGRPLGVGGDAPVVEQVRVGQAAVDVVLVVGLQVVEAR